MARDSKGVRYAAVERIALAETLTEVGPGAPTLCEGWTSQDLAAHLVVRERRPLASLGNAVRPLAGYTDRVQRRLAEDSVAAGDYAGLVAAVRQGPQRGLFRIAQVSEALNLVEYFVHHEDLRRAQPGWTARSLPEGYVDALWRRVGTFARMRPPRRDAVTVLVAPGHGQVIAGRRGQTTAVTGAPEELLLWLFGRRTAADVTVDGPGD